MNTFWDAVEVSLIALGLIAIVVLVLLLGSAFWPRREEEWED